MFGLERLCRAIKIVCRKPRRHQCRSLQGGLLWARAQLIVSERFEIVQNLQPSRRWIGGFGNSVTYSLNFVALNPPAGETWRRVSTKAVLSA